MPEYSACSWLDRLGAVTTLPFKPPVGCPFYQLVRDNAAADEFIVHASGDYTLIHSIVVSNDKLFPIDEDDLLSWGCNPYTSIASYCSGGEREGVWGEN